MAKNDKSFEKATMAAIDELLKDGKTFMKEAIDFAVQQAKKDLMIKAKTCLQEYYDNYEPTRYERTETLQYAFLPYLHMTQQGDKISGQVGVEYDPSMLEAMMPDPVFRKNSGKIKHEGYYGSSNYQPVDTEWVLDNYLRGIHPVTNGGTTSDTTVYYEIFDDMSPNQKMEKYISNYNQTFDTNVLFGMLAQIAKKMN